jgi:MoxR-like ATPase
MIYRDASSKPIVLVDVDASDLDIEVAADQIVASGHYPRPLIWWHNASGFHGDIATDGADEGKAPRIQLSEDEQQAASVERALRVVQRSPHAGTYLIASNFDDVPGYESDTLRDRLLSVVTHVQDRGGKQFVLVTSGKAVQDRHGDILAPLKERNPGYGRFETSAAGPAPSDADMRTAILAPAPEQPGQRWDWAEDGVWADRIDALDATQLRTLIAEGWHEPALERLRAALKEAQARFCRRNRALEMLVACALARVNLVYLGPPGTAKSLLVRTFAQTLGVRNVSRPIREEAEAASQAKRRANEGRQMFEYLLTRYTTPEEIFGGADINLLLAAGVHGRRTVGMLPQAEIGFLDELFKANTAILNALLSLTNERIFYNLGQAFRVNLAFVVGASNETPAEEELGALYDRFPIRVPCLPVRPDEQLEVMQRAHEFETQGHVNVRRACLNDLRLLSRVVLADERYGGVRNVFPAGGTEFQQWFIQFLTAVREEFKVSDRTPYLVLRLCRALALLEGSDRMCVRHLRAWGYVAPKVAGAMDLQRLLRSKILHLDNKEAGLFDEV